MLIGLVFSQFQSRLKRPSSALTHGITKEQHGLDVQQLTSIRSRRGSGMVSSTLAVHMKSTLERSMGTSR